MSGRRVLVVLTTTPNSEIAELIGRTLVVERLAACANVLPGVTSIFRWKGAVERDSETLMILKTTATELDALRARVMELHPYEVPEVLALPVEAGHEPYLEWVFSSVGAEP